MLPQNKISGTKIAFGHGAYLYDEKEKGFFNFVKESDFGWLLPISELQKVNVTEQDLLDCVEQVEAALGDPEELRAVLPFGSGLKNVGTVFRSKNNPRVICVFTPTSQLVQDVEPLNLPEQLRPDGYFEWYLSDEDSITVDDIGSGGNNVGAMGKWLGDFDRMAGTRNTNLADAPVFKVPTYTEAVQQTSGVMGAVQREVFLEDVHAYHRKQMPWFKKEQLKKEILGTWESVQRVRSSLTEDVGTYKSNVPLYLETVTGVEPVKFVFHGFIAESKVSLGEQEGLCNLKKFCESEDNLSRLRLMTDCGLRKARSLTESNGNLVLEFEGEEQVLPQDEDLFKALKNKQPAKPTPKGTLIQGLDGRMDISNETFRPYNKGLIVFLRDGSFPDVKRIFGGKGEVLLWIDAQIYLARLNEEFKALQTGRALPNQSTALSVMGDLLNNPQKGQERFSKLFVKESKPVGESALDEASSPNNKLATKLLAFIKDQINLDLTPFVHEKQPHPRRYLGVDVSYRGGAENSRELMALKKLEGEYGKGFFQISDNGGLGIALRYGPKLKGEGIDKPEKVTEAVRDSDGRIRISLHTNGKSYLMLMQDDPNTWSGVEMDSQGKVTNEYANEEDLDGTFQHIADSKDLPDPVKAKVRELYQSWSY